jgi:hypothetical protein
MPNLITSLRAYDLGHLRIVADLWGLELTTPAAHLTVDKLCASLLDPELARELIDSLNPEARRALDALAAHAGRIPWAEFERLYGSVRKMGPGKRDREKPHLNPASPTEALFYRALFARAFFDTLDGAREFAYIPEDLLSLLNRQVRREHKGQIDKNFAVQSPDKLGRAATPAERAHVLPADDRILDDATTWLAALRLGITPPETSIPYRVLQSLLLAAGLILPRGEGEPRTESIRTFLEAPRKQALKMLTDAWRDSETFNELRQIPGLVFEGQWKNPALATRQSMFDFLASIPKGKWWSLSALIQDIKAARPDFQRPAGDYDSWFIKRAFDGAYLRGFAAWDEVDGALIRYFIAGVLHWLGLADLATPKDRDTIAALRLTSPVSIKAENGKISVGSNGKISIPRLAPRAARYLISRFCEWDEHKTDEYRYHVTPASLNKAKDQGLKVEHLLPLLAKHSAGIPPAFVKALKRWGVNGTEARMQKQVVLRVNRPEVLEEMRKSKAARFLGEILSPTAVIVRDGAQAKVLAALAELGLLTADESMKNVNEHE